MTTGEPCEICADRLGRLTLYKSEISLSFLITQEVTMKKVGIVMGSTSDLPVVEKAIAVLQEECDRVTAAKASDELLTIKGVCASFVLYPKGESVYISARSLGDVNVQVIVEELGGGGNSTTAGGYLHYSDVEEAKAQLLQSIDKYFEN